MSLCKTETYYPKTKQHWRKWLVKNHIRKDAVWLTFYKKQTGKPTLNTNDAIDEALCFGWIDGKAETVDSESYRQYFCKRKTKTTWSKINKDKVKYLIENGLMMEAGFASIEVAKQNGSWTILDEVEELIIPDDLLTALKSNLVAKSYFDTLSKSLKKSIPQWLVLSRRQETRQKRITEIVKLGNKKQNSFNKNKINSCE